MASLKELTVGIPGAGRRTLLSVLPEEMELPENLRLCVLDASRSDSPAQLALLDQLAAEPGLEPIFVLNKADLINGLRTTVTRTLALLRERGFSEPRLWLCCAEAARIFRSRAPAESSDELRAQNDFYFRYSPGEQSLSAFAVTGAPGVVLGSRELNPEQLRLALENTGVPALAAALAAMRTPRVDAERAERPARSGEHCSPREDEATGNRQQATGNGEDSAPARRDGSQPSASPEEAADEAIGNRQQAIGDGETGPSAPLRCAQDDKNGDAPARRDGSQPSASPEEAAEEATDNRQQATDEATGNRQQATGDGEDSASSEEDEDLLADIPCAIRDSEPLPRSAASLAAEPLESLLAMAETASCAQLLELARAAGAADASAEEQDRALEILQARYAARQTEELEQLTQGAEAMKPEELRALSQRIAQGPYTAQAKAPYTDRLDRRLEQLQSQTLEALCAGAEEADAGTLAQMRRALERADCPEALKARQLRRLEARQDQLDLEALERVTAGAEHMTEKELRALAVTLEAGNWNPRFVNRYRQRVDLCREAAAYRQVREALTELNDMERREVLALRERVSGWELPSRFTAAALEEIGEKLYRLDMLRLMALNNDFDRLDFEQMDELRAQVGRGDYCDRAKTEYLNRLLDREDALILENTSARAEMSRQLIARHKLRMSDFCFASRGPEYLRRLEEFWAGSGLEQARDIPVFLFNNGSTFAMTGTRFYFKTGRHLEYYPMENIERFQVMRQHLSLLLQIVGKDSSYRLTEARISRGGADRTLEFLNECVSRWAEPGPAGRLAADLRVRRLDPAEYAAPVEPRTLSPRLAWELFCRAWEAAGLRESNLIRPEDKSAQERLPKLRLSLGLGENTALIWYASAARLGPVKEGVALGPRGIYSKEGKNPVLCIPLETILSIRPVGSRRAEVVTLGNERFTLPVSDDMAALIWDYVRSIQLGAWLAAREERA